MNLPPSAQFTGGNLFYYPAYTTERDGEKFGTELYNLLTRPTGFEAVMRVRVTRGLKVPYVIPTNPSSSNPNPNPLAGWSTVRVRLRLRGRHASAGHTRTQGTLRHTD